LNLLQITKLRGFVHIEQCKQNNEQDTNSKQLSPAMSNTKCDQVCLMFMQAVWSV